MSNLLKTSLGSFFLFWIMPLSVHSQKVNYPDYSGYVSKYKNIAIREMQLYKIPASITLAQGIIESSCGMSPLATEANNHFGIKCHKDWTGDKYYYDDDEKLECFRKYSSAEESFRDHSLFLVGRQRYAALFSLDPDDYTGWAMGLRQAGYATNPDYPNILIRFIEANKLYMYDDPTLTPGTETENGRNEELLTEDSSQEQNNSLDSGKTSFPNKYKMPDPSLYEVIRTSSSGRKVYENNGIPFILVRKDDTWYTIGKEFGVYASQVYKDNDLRENDVLTIGQIIYLEPKKRKNDAGIHLVGKEDTLYSIAQQYGIKLKFLYKYNGLKPGDEPSPGSVILLSKDWRK